MISGIQIALKNAIDVVSDNPDKFRSFVVGSVFDHATAYNVLHSFDREKKTRTFSFIFLLCLRSIVNSVREILRQYPSIVVRHYMFYVNDDFSSFDQRALLHVPLYLFTFCVYRSVCCALRHSRYTTVYSYEFFLLVLRARPDRFKSRSFGAHKKIQINRTVRRSQLSTGQYHAGNTQNLPISIDTRICALSNRCKMYVVIFSGLCNYFKLHLRTNCSSLTCARLIIYRVLYLTWFSSTTTQMT